jgi:hypothetical protein
MYLLFAKKISQGKSIFISRLSLKCSGAGRIQNKNFQKLFKSMYKFSRPRLANLMVIQDKYTCFLLKCFKIIHFYIVCCNSSPVGLQLFNGSIIPIRFFSAWKKMHMRFSLKSSYPRLI